MTLTVALLRELNLFFQSNYTNQLVPHFVQIFSWINQNWDFILRLTIFKYSEGFSLASILPIEVSLMASSENKYKTIQSFSSFCKVCQNLAMSPIKIVLLRLYVRSSLLRIFFICNFFCCMNYRADSLFSSFIIQIGEQLK